MNEEEGKSLRGERAIAFVDALTGNDGLNDNGDPSGRMSSPGAQRHLEAVLGPLNVPNAYAARRVIYGQEKNSPRVKAFVKYLREVADALDPS